jgi:hypothetical protein
LAARDHERKKKRIALISKVGFDPTTAAFATTTPALYIARPFLINGRKYCCFENAKAYLLLFEVFSALAM